MAVTTIEAMVPVRLSGDGVRLTGVRFELLLQSLSLHWADAEPLRLTIVGLREELPVLREIARARPGLALRFLDERELIDDLRFLVLPGWFKQSLVKLFFARVCEADAYLYLDSDLICVRPLTRAHLLSDGRAVTGWEPKNTHPGWWDGARRVLKRASSDRRWGLAVTPNIFIAEVALAALGAVERANRTPPLDALLAATGDASTCWVENTLYSELAEVSGDLDRWHTPLSHPTPFRSAADLWSPDGLADWRPVEALTAAPGTRFVVVQSTIGLDPAYIRQRLSPVMDARA